MVHTQCGNEALVFREAKPLLSYRIEAACPLPDIHLVGHVFADYSPFLPLFSIHQSLAVK